MTVGHHDGFRWRGLIVILVISPLFAGSIPPTVESLLLLGVFLLLGHWALRPPLQGAGWSAHARSRTTWMMAAWALAVGFALIQAIPLPLDLVAVISPSLSALYSWTLPEDPNGGIWHALSTTPADTMRSGLLLAACASAFFLVTGLCRMRRRMVALSLTIILVGAGEAIYALAKMNGELAEPASGTFINRNHFAALLAMALCQATGLLLMRWQESNSIQSGADAAAAIPSRLERWVSTSPLVILGLTIVAGLIFSFSRMGLTAPIAMLVIFGMLWLGGPVSKRMRLLGAVTTLLAVLLLAGAYPALEVVAQRFQELEYSSRMAAWQGTIMLFRTSPIVGLGLGSFVDNVPRFLPASHRGTLDHSHNELLEIFADGGVVYGAILGFGLIVYYGTLVPAWLRRKGPLARGLGMGCLAGSAAVLCHSLVDFPLRMPSNLLYLSVVMGLGWVTILHPGTDTVRDTDHPSKELPLNRTHYHFAIRSIAVAGIGLAVLASTANFFNQVGDGLIKRATQGDMTQNAQQQSLHSAGQLYHLASVIEPWQPKHPFKLGQTLERKAARAPALSREAKFDWASTTQAYKRAVALHPANGRLQAALAWASLQSGDLTTARRSARAAMRLTPHDQHVRLAITKWHLVQWGNLTEEEKHQATALLRQGTVEQPAVYVDSLTRLVHDGELVKGLLPNDLQVRRVFINTLTAQGRFVERWAEQASHPALRTPMPDAGMRVLTQGRLKGRREPPPRATIAGRWEGLAQGWLSGSKPAKLKIDLPPGEAVLYMEIRAQAADQIWPQVTGTVAGTSLPLQLSDHQQWRTHYFLVTSAGGTHQIQMTLNNPAVILEDDEFVERRVALGPVRLLTPDRMLDQQRSTFPHQPGDS